MRLRHTAVLLYRSDGSRQAVSRDGAVGFSISVQGRVAAGRLWRSSGMAPEHAHRGVHIAEDPCEPAHRWHTVEIENLGQGWPIALAPMSHLNDFRHEHDDKRHTTL